MTIAASTAISAFVSLTLPPALAAILLKAHVADAPHDTRAVQKLMQHVNAFFRVFNAGFDWLSSRYGWLTGKVIRLTFLMLVVYAGKECSPTIAACAVVTFLLPSDVARPICYEWPVFQGDRVS